MSKDKMELKACPIQGCGEEATTGEQRKEINNYHKACCSNTECVLAWQWMTLAAWQAIPRRSEELGDIIAEIGRHANPSMGAFVAVSQNLLRIWFSRLSDIGGGVSGEVWVPGYGVSGDRMSEMRCVYASLSDTPSNPWVGWRKVPVHGVPTQTQTESCDHCGGTRDEPSECVHLIAYSDSLDRMDERIDDDIEPYRDALRAARMRLGEAGCELPFVCDGIMLLHSERDKARADLEKSNERIEEEFARASGYHRRWLKADAKAERRKEGIWKLLRSYYQGAGAGKLKLDLRTLLSETGSDGDTKERNPSACCGNCEHWGTAGSCEGPGFSSAEHGWCDKWKAKPDDSPGPLDADCLEAASGHCDDCGNCQDGDSPGPLQRARVYLEKSRTAESSGHEMSQLRSCMWATLDWAEAQNKRSK